MQDLAVTVGNVMCTFCQCSHIKDSIVTRVTSGNKWSGQSVKNIFNPPEVRHNPQWHLSGGLVHLGNDSVSESQMLGRGRDLSRLETGDNPLSQWEVWMSSCQSAQLVLWSSRAGYRPDRNFFEDGRKSPYPEWLWTAVNCLLWLSWRSCWTSAAVW